MQTSTTPSDGEWKVEPAKPLERAGVTDQTITLVESYGSSVTGVISFNASGTSVTFYPSEILKSETQYSDETTFFLTDLSTKLTIMQPLQVLNSDINSLKFEIDLDSISGWGQYLNSTIGEVGAYKIKVPLKARDNSNVAFGEVLNGNAIFAYDTNPANTGPYKKINIINGEVLEQTDVEKRFYFVQELLNQVLTRKRKFITGTDTEIQNDYKLIDEDGLYDDVARAAVLKFGKQFGMIKNGASDTRRIGNNTASFADNQTGSYVYNDDDDTSDVFRKVMKDYNLRTYLSDSYWWVGRIVDKSLLVGNEQLIPENLEVFNPVVHDVKLNDGDGFFNPLDDTGLYELYRNVVERFNNRIITLAESYADYDSTENVNWVARTGQTGADTNGAVAYSYGARLTIKEFDQKVSRWGAPTNTVYEGSDITKIKHANLAEITFDVADYRNKSEDQRNALTNIIEIDRATLNLMTEADKISFFNGLIVIIANENIAYNITGIDVIYKGNIDEGSGKIDPNATIKTNMWPGLKRAEYRLRNTHEQYRPNYWAGIDCVGLVMHGLRYAEKPQDYASSQYIIGQNKTEIPDIDLGDLCVSYRKATVADPASAIGPGNMICTVREDIHHSASMPLPLASTNVKKFFNDSQKELMYFWEKSEDGDEDKMIHRGDFVQYGTTHISTVYSPRPNCDDNGGNCSYEIIHASGNSYLDLNGNGRHEPNEFSRKVRTNSNIFISSPKGFGRIKLWD